MKDYKDDRKPNANPKLSRHSVALPSKADGVNATPEYTPSDVRSAY